jgi:hypothetical protein
MSGTMNVMARADGGVVGLVLGMKGGRLTVMRTSAPDAPAARAGIVRGDRLVRIDQVTTEGLTRKEAARQIGGPVGEKVTLWIERAGVANPIAFELTREPAPGSEPLPPGTRKFLLALFGTLVAIAVGVVLMVSRSRDHEDAAAAYAGYLREGETQRAYALLSSESPGASSYDTWLETMNTPLLRRATDFRIGSVKKSSAGHGCVRASAEVDDTRVHLTVYTDEQSEGVRIHSVVTNAEENRDAWARVRPWDC